MKHLFFILWALLLISCTATKPGLSVSGSQTVLRAKTLQGIDQALTPMITANDMRRAFRLTIAYADSLHQIPTVTPTPEGWNPALAQMNPEDTLRQVLPVVVIVVICLAVVGGILLIYVAMQQHTPDHP